MLLMHTSINSEKELLRSDSIINCNNLNPYSHEIKGMIFLERSLFKEFIILPLLSIVSFLMLPLVIYWYPYLNLLFRFGHAHTLTSSNIKSDNTKAQIINEIV
jgi:hypothetical protein